MMNTPRITAFRNRCRRLLETAISRASVWAPMLLVLVPSQRAAAAALPEERGDTLFHIYDGGGQTVLGPAVLVRKNFAEKFSLSAGYYVDEISGASIDVVTNASPYHEERREAGVGGQYLYRDTLLGFNYTNSIENDFKASTFDFSISQDFFNNTTTLSLGYSKGNDKITRVDSPEFSATANRANYSVSVTQVINPTLLGTLSYELSADDGYLQNPYRSARVLGAALPEIYPGTRTGQAFATKLVKSWSSRFSTRIEGRYYRDTWGIKAFNVGIGASWYVYRNWILDGGYRFYSQKAATFYSDNFQRPQNFLARDKELATYQDHTVNAKLTVPLITQKHGFLNHVDAGVSFEYLLLDYKNFTDLRNGKPYSFGAAIGQFFLTAYY
jgi:hypothetical protein